MSGLLEAIDNLTSYVKQKTTDGRTISETRQTVDGNAINVSADDPSLDRSSGRLDAKEFKELKALDAALGEATYDAPEVLLPVADKDASECLNVSNLPYRFAPGFKGLGALTAPSSGPDLSQITAAERQELSRLLSIVWPEGKALPIDFTKPVSSKSGPSDDTDVPNRWFLATGPMLSKWFAGMRTYREKIARSMKEEAVANATK
jgi:hypothetical protein